MKITIVVSVTHHPQVNPPPVPANPGVGWVDAFDDDLVLERYNNRTPGNGPNDLPQNPAQRRAGTHSGTLTLLRIAQAGDFFYKAGAWLFQYDATYRFKKVAQTALEQGQISTHGLLLIDSTNQFAALDQPITFAITGGTGRYRTARGEVTEPNKTERALEVEV